jgi:hypothetical protein
MPSYMFMAAAIAANADGAKPCAAAAASNAAVLSYTAQGVDEINSIGCMPFLRVLNTGKASAVGKATASWARRILGSFKSSPADVKGKSEAKAGSVAKAASVKKMKLPSLKKFNQMRWSAGQAVTGLFRATRQ